MAQLHRAWQRAKPPHEFQTDLVNIQFFVVKYGFRLPARGGALQLCIVIERLLRPSLSQAHQHSRNLPQAMLFDQSRLGLQQSLNDRNVETRRTFER